jgi:hypothetical protein
MATSGSINFTSTLRDIIKDALLELNVANPDETPSSSDEQFAARTLNRMIKAWQTQSINIWKTSTATIFFQKNQGEYEIYSTGDHATETYTETTIGADEASGQTTITVTSSTGMTADDYVGIEQDDGALHWSTIATVSDSTTIIINDALTDDAASGNKVYAYTTRLAEPFLIYSMAREAESQLDTPLNALSYEEYFQLPNKVSYGTPTSYSYDRQLGKAIIKLWPIPSDVDYVGKITLAKRIEDFDLNTNTPDFPQEWHDTLILNLAARMAHAFGKDKGDSYISLRQDAQASLNNMLSFDNEERSVYFQPDFYGRG